MVAKECDRDATVTVVHSRTPNAAKICAGEICAGEICAGEICAGEICAGEIHIVISIVDPPPRPGRKIDYMIVSHTEPDHSGLIPAVLDRFPDAMVVGSKVSQSTPPLPITPLSFLPLDCQFHTSEPPLPHLLKVCLQFLTGLTHRPFTQMAVKGGDKIDLGQVSDERASEGRRGLKNLLLSSR